MVQPYPSKILHNVDLNEKNNNKIIPSEQSTSTRLKAYMGDQSQTLVLDWIDQIDPI